MGKLTATQVKAIRQPGRYHDGAGLMLFCKGPNARSWVLRKQWKGKRRDYGLGAFPEVSLSEARERALEAIKEIREGRDPSVSLKNSSRILDLPTAFEDVATAYHEKIKDRWRNPKHQDQWISTLRSYAFPKLGKIDVADITAVDVRDAVQPIWNSKPETARRLLQRIIAVLNEAHFMELRDQEAPQQSIKRALGKQQDKARHHMALPYAELPALVRTLEGKDAVGSMALLFTILTACRSGEVRNARWSEIDFQRKQWIIPAERMKAGVQHRVPLTQQMLDIIERVKSLRKNSDSLLFPSSTGKPLSDMTLLKAMKAAADQEATVHGCRSSFRDWAGEQTDYPAPAAEAALAHTIRNKAEAAYHRTDYLEIRRKLMADWSAFLAGG